MSDYRFGAEDYRLNYRPHEVMDKDGYIDWEKVEAVEIDRVDFIRKPDDKSRWFEMFGTPERAARTICRQLKHYNICICDGCPVQPLNQECDSEYDALLEWMRGDAE